MSSVAILTYHSIDNSGSVISTAPETFRAQMTKLRTLGYRVLTLTELLDAWQMNTALPTRTAVITFDDAYENFVVEAAPVLVAYNFHATVFAVSGKLGAKNDWPEQAKGMPALQLMSATQLRDMHSAGFEIGAHTVNHVRLTTLDPEASAAEIVGCKTALEQQLGTAITTFAYPFGAIDARVTEIVANHYRAAVGTRLAEARSTTSLHTLPRVDMYYFRNPLGLRLFGTAAGSLYRRARAVGRAMREVIAE